jgi:type I restriction enzyme S subunit
MSVWKEILFTDYYEISSGLSKSASEFGHGYPFLSFKNVFENYFIPDELTQLVNSNEKERNNCSVKKGDIFLTRTSETKEELGMSCVALKDYENATFNGFTKRLRPKLSNEIDPVFIGFYLRSPKFRSDISAFANLITRASLNNDAIGRLKIHLPPINTQKRIGSILYSYSCLIENNLKRIKLLEEIAQRTYEEWFVKFRVNGEQLPLDENTGLPVGWERKKITNCNSFKQHKEKVKKFDGELIYLATADVEGAQITGAGEPVTWENKPSRAQIKLIKESVWFARMSNTYKVIIVSSNFNKQYIISSGFAGFISKNSHCLPFLFCLINSKDFHDKKDLFATGATQVSLNDISLGTIEITEPTLDLVELFGEKFIKTLEIRQNLIDQNQKLKESRDILLPKLMNGTINVE